MNWGNLKAVFLLCLLANPVFAAEQTVPAPVQTYNLTATGLQQILAMLQEVPAKWANPISNEIMRQIHESQVVAGSDNHSVDKQPKK